MTIRHFTTSIALLGIASLVVLTSSCHKDQPDADAYINARIDDTFVSDTSALVEIQTFRDDAPDSEERVVANLRRIQDYLNARAEAFNAGQAMLRLEPFDWQEEIDGQTRWVFGFRVGDGPRKFSMLTHMDTVPPGVDAWRPFEPRLETKAYRGGEQPFLVGRGAVDDKGPGVLTVTVLEAAAKRFDGTDALDDWTLEVSFDTAEETDMNMPYYIDAVGPPELGIVFDAYWCVRAEKGIERPVFSLPRGETGAGPLWIATLETPPGAVNQIPGSTTAWIEGSDPASLDLFADEVESLYDAYGFDDPDYRRAPLTVARTDSAVVLTTTVLGAQHGSVPYENRADGANPLVSLANFLAGLVDDGTLAANGYGQMAQFMAWGWGTEVFGEKHPELLERFDEVFQEGNGTTYALTRVTSDDELVNLAIDIRYALGHHDQPWDGTTQGLLPGSSIFPEVFEDLVAQFNAEYPEAGLTFTTENAFAPDVRDPDSTTFQNVSQGYQDVMAEACPEIATGGGTDAKGHVTMLAAGALFSDDFGPPINYHGLDEGAPVDDLRQSALILYHVLLRQVGQAQ
jgi:succinyl-diaminopimelate desuccinylase